MNFKTWRRSKKINQRDMAAMLEVSPSTLSRWESGATVPAWPSLERIIDVTKGKVREKDFMQGPRK